MSATEKPIFPLLPEPLPLARFSAADDLRAAIGLWVAWLAGERRASAHTVAAYGRDLAFFLDFLTEHLGELPSLAAIDAAAPGRFPRLSGAARRRRHRAQLAGARHVGVARLRALSAAARARLDHGARGTALRRNCRPACPSR